jgi:hypothetical protein
MLTNVVNSRHSTAISFVRYLVEYGSTPYQIIFQIRVKLTQVRCNEINFYHEPTFCTMRNLLKFDTAPHVSK